MGDGRAISREPLVPFASIRVIECRVMEDRSVPSGGPAVSGPVRPRFRIAIAIVSLLTLALLLLAGMGTWVLTRRPFASLPPINAMGRQGYKVVPYLREARRLQAM